MRIFGKVRHRPSASWRQATDRAFTLIGDGRYEDAGALLTRAADLEPWLSESWFNLALLHKFRHDWEQARAAGLRAVALLDRESGAPDWWNVGIAATALQDWPLARRAWQAYGLKVPGGGQHSGATTEPSGMELGSAACTPLARGRGRGGLGPTARSGPDRGAVDPAAVLRAALGRGRPARRGAQRRAGHRRRARLPGVRRDRAVGAVPGAELVVLLEAATEEDRDALEKLASDAGFAAEDWSSSVRLLCRACSESRMESDEGDGEHLDPHDHSEPGHPGPLGHRTAGAGDLWVPERECGLAAPAGLVRGLLDGWVADSPDSREWRDLEEVC
ncbi:hypothetical protein SCALM49S_06061 [Streptomyces californicus]